MVTCWFSLYPLGHFQAMWLMLQHDKPEDFVVATGEAHSVRELVELAFKQIKMEIRYGGGEEGHSRILCFLPATGGKEKESMRRE